MTTPLLSYDQRAHGQSTVRRHDIEAPGHVETPAEALNVLAAQPPGDALTWLTRYLRRRSRVLDELAAEDLTAVLETLATDFRAAAAAEPTSPYAAGLSLAAAVVSDTAAAIRVDSR